jgi:aryl-alcohol dehydrogenase-like predicted oxidoreductase
LHRADKVKADLGIEGKELTQAAIRFGLMNQKGSTVLVGFSNTTHVDEAVACSGMPELSSDQMTKVKRLWETDFDS